MIHAINKLILKTQHKKINKQLENNSYADEYYNSRKVALKNVSKKDLIRIIVKLELKLVSMSTAQKKKSKLILN